MSARALAWRDTCAEQDEAAALSSRVVIRNDSTEWDNASLAVASDVCGSTSSSSLISFNITLAPSLFRLLPNVVDVSMCSTLPVESIEGSNTSSDRAESRSARVR